MAHTVSDSDEIISGINVTPLVDVVLVILIIFIVTASAILRSSIPMELPRAATGEASTAGLLSVAIGKRGELVIDGRPAGLDQIPRAVGEARRRAEQQRTPLAALVSADIAASYGLFAQVVDRLRLEGVTSIALDTQPTTLQEREGK